MKRNFLSKTNENIGQLLLRFHYGVTLIETRLQGHPLVFLKPSLNTENHPVCLEKGAKPNSLYLVSLQFICYSRASKIKINSGTIPRCIFLRNTLNIVKIT